MAIAAGDITVADQGGHKQSVPLFADRISFLGEASYEAGGMILADGLTEALLSKRTIMGVLANDCGGYSVAWIPATGALKVYEEGADGGPADEVTATTDLNSVTFNIVVFSK